MDSSYLSASECQTDMINVSDKPAEESDMHIKRVGIDLAKSVFQIHGVDDQERVRWMNVRWIRASNPPKTELRCYVGHCRLLTRKAESVGRNRR